LAQRTGKRRFIRLQTFITFRCILESCGTRACRVVRIGNLTLFLRESEVSAGRNLTFTNRDDERKVRRIDETEKSCILFKETIATSRCCRDELSTTTERIWVGCARSGDVDRDGAGSGALWVRFSGKKCW
jgi:hypothetical protein